MFVVYHQCGCLADHDSDSNIGPNVIVILVLIFLLIFMLIFMLSSVTILKPTSKVELKDPCPFLPSLSNSIDIEWTEARGRFAVANRPIPAGGGDLLGLEEKKKA